MLVLGVKNGNTERLGERAQDHTTRKRQPSLHPTIPFILQFCCFLSAPNSPFLLSSFSLPCILLFLVAPQTHMWDYQSLPQLAHSFWPWIASAILQFTASVSVRGSFQIVCLTTGMWIVSLRLSCSAGRKPCVLLNTKLWLLLWPPFSRVLLPPCENLGKHTLRSHL